MKIGFKCERGNILFADCFKCEQECLTLPTRQMMSDVRPWTGTASTTQCLNGTRLEYLKIKKDYYVDPQDQAFALLGTRHHQALESVAKKLGILAEEKLEDEVTGVADLLEANGGSFTLTDYKTWGAFAVMKALGITYQLVPSGEVYKRAGSWGKVGDPKMMRVFTTKPETADLFNPTLQLNNYRLMFEQRGLVISKMRIQATVRDWVRDTPKEHGLHKKIYLIPIPRLPDDTVADYFWQKSTALLAALEKNELPPPCSPREMWDGRRCSDYCEVREFCSEGIKGGE